MKVVFAGTPDFAVPSLESLINSAEHRVIAVVTQPDKPIGRKGIITPPPVKTTAEKYGVPVFQFEKIRKDGVETLKNLNADVMVTCAYGQLLSQEIIDLFPYGVINIHASLLPLYRGAAPIQYAVVDGARETGVTLMQTDIGLDTGDIISVYKTNIGEDETAGELAERLSVIGAEHICGALSDIECGRVCKVKQDESRAFTVRPIKKEQAEINFGLPAESVKNFILGMNPSPIAYTFLNGKKLKIYRAQVYDGVSNRRVGEVIKADKEILVACGGGVLKITELQEEGGKKMDARSFAIGRKIKAGDVLGRKDA